MIDWLLRKAIALIGQLPGGPVRGKYSKRLSLLIDRLEEMRG